HARQREYHESTARFRLASCGRRFGKTTMVARDLEPDLLIPNTVNWIVGPSYSLGEKEFRVIWDDLMVKLGMLNLKGIQKSYNVQQGKMFIKFPWNTVLEVKSANKAESLVGESLDRVIMAEAAKHNDETWQRFIRPALSDKRGRADFATTPEGYNWFYDLWRLGLDDKFPDYKSWKFPSWENDIVYPGGM